jgi:predicted histidine transporter YuiF (NhaC family)
LFVFQDESEGGEKSSGGVVAVGVVVVVVVVVVGVLVGLGIFIFIRKRKKDKEVEEYRSKKPVDSNSTEKSSLSTKRAAAVLTFILSYCFFFLF